MNTIIVWIVTLLVVVIGILAALLAWLIKESKEERSKLINSLVARNATELAQIEYTEKLPKQEPSKAPDLVPFEQMNEEEFDKHIEEELKAQNA